MLNLYFYYKNKLIYHALKELISDLKDVRILGATHMVGPGPGIPELKDCDAIVMEIDLPDYQIIEYISAIKDKFAEISVMVIGSNGAIASPLLKEMLDLGIMAYIFKDCSKLDLVNALEKVKVKERQICTKVFEKVWSQSQNHDKEIIQLTPREYEVLSFVVQGELNKNIAKSLHISESTVKTHRKNIMQKLKTDNLIGMVINSLKLRLLSPKDLPFCRYCY